MKYFEKAKFWEARVTDLKILKCKVEKNGRRNEMERALAFRVKERERERERERDGLNEELKVAKGLIAELTPPHAQSAWGFRGKGFELWG